MPEYAAEVSLYALVGVALAVLYLAPDALNIRLFDQNRVVLGMLLFLLRLSMVGLTFIRIAQQGWTSTLPMIFGFLLVLLLSVTVPWKRGK